jgi:hypothetical protein
MWPMVCVVCEVEKNDKNLKGLDIFVMDGNGVYRL